MIEVQRESTRLYR